MFTRTSTTAWHSSAQPVISPSPWRRAHLRAKAARLRRLPAEAPCCQPSQPVYRCSRRSPSPSFQRSAVLLRRNPNGPNERAGRNLDLPLFVMAFKMDKAIRDTADLGPRLKRRLEGFRPHFAVRPAPKRSPCNPPLSSIRVQFAETSTARVSPGFAPSI